jgi:hypothetical protein
MKKGPANKTDTSFTSKKVIIRSQSIASVTNPSTGSSELDTISKIRACLINCGHYNGNMRKDSTLNVLKCLKELSDLQSPTLLAVLDPIFVATFRQICDEEIGVRTAFLGLIGFILENFPSDRLAGFFPRWLSFLNLASSHIKPEIRRDSIRFISMTLKTQKSLFLPNIHTTLQSIIPLLTQYPLKSGSVPPFECAMALIDAYIEPFVAGKTDKNQLNTPLFSFTWSSSVSQPPLFIVRTSPSTFGGSTTRLPQLFIESELKTIIAHLGNLSISVFLDTVHLLNKTANPTNTSLKTSLEFKQINDLISLYRKLYALAKICCGDSEVFWRAMPVKLVKSYRNILEDLIK